MDAGTRRLVWPAGMLVKRLKTRRSIAWLATLALWLIVTAPVVSQIVATDTVLSMVGACSSDHDHATPPLRHPMSMESCGYCGLLGHSPALLGAAIACPPTSPPSARLVVAAPNIAQAIPLITAASPRGPPQFLEHQH